MSSSTTIWSHEDAYRTRAGEPALVEVPPARFLVIDGSGSPGGDPFEEAVRALYAIAYASKFALRKAGGPDVKVPPLEGLYDALADPSEALDAAVRRTLRWRLTIRLPDAIDEALVETARAGAARKKQVRRISDVRVEAFDEGLAVQLLHVGPYSAEGATIERLRAFTADRALHPRGRHHEIYLSVPGRTKPDRMKTILREPVS